MKLSYIQVSGGNNDYRLERVSWIGETPRVSFKPFWIKSYQDCWAAFED